MGRKAWISLVCLGWLLLVGCQTTPQTEQKDQNQTQVSLDPQETYSQNCAMCHGGNLEGGMGPTLQKVGSKMDKAKIDQIIKNGIGNMPAQTQVTPQAREKLAEWLAQKK